jgi:glycine hydroxymethyltransferase
MEEIAECIDTVLVATGTLNEAATLDAVKKRVAAITARHPLPYQS